MERQYIAIDLKSFYASVECVERGLDPLTTRLVVADSSRTEKTICLAVSPALKALGLPGRPRLFQVVQTVNMINEKRAEDDKVDYIVAVPRMELYMKYSTRIFNIYLDFVSSEDVHVYSVDEVFIDATDYLNTYGMSARELALRMIRKVLRETGITATAGIGTNLYLCKVAMDIVAKRMAPDEDGVRIAELTEETYRRELWTHRPLTDFWRIGKGYARKLAEHGMYTMGDVARCSLGGKYDLFNQDLLYRLFGINAELLIDHAWGYEPCRISDIKAYKPSDSSISQGQVLSCGYDFDKAKLVVMEMTDQLSLELVDRKLVADQIVLTICYDVKNMQKNGFTETYLGDIKTDYYGRSVPGHAHGTISLGCHTSSTRIMMEKMGELFDRIVDPELLVRRMYVVAGHVIPEGDEQETVEEYEQMDLFTDYAARDRSREHDRQELEKEKQLQQALLNIKKKYGKNAVLKGMNFREGATARERNAQVGGHRA